MFVDLGNFVESGLIHKRRIYFLFRGYNNPIRSYAKNMELGLLKYYREHKRELAPLIPREVLPAATALSAYSICTSFPDGEKVVREKL